MDLFEVIDDLWDCSSRFDVACKAVGNRYWFPDGENVSCFMEAIYTEFCTLIDKLTVINTELCEMENIDNEQKNDSTNNKAV